MQGAAVGVAEPSALPSQERVALEGRGQVAVLGRSSRISRPLWAKNSSGLRQTTLSMSSSEKPASCIAATVLATLSGSETPQSQAELIRIRSVPMSSTIRTMRYSSIFVFG